MDYGASGYTSADEAAVLGQAKAWCYVKSEKAEGWMAAWLLKKKG
jgi:hypothetical protein